MEKKLLWSLAVIELFVTVGLLVFVFWLIQDEPPYDDTALIPAPYVAIPAAKNAFPYFDEANSKAVYRKEDYQKLTAMLDGKVSWDQHFAEQLVSQYTAALASFEKGQEYTELRYPYNTRSPKSLDEWQNWQNWKTPRFGNYHFLAELEHLKIEKLRREGKEKEAWKEAIDLLHTAHLVGQDGLIAVAVGVAIQDQALDEITILLQQSTLSPKQLKMYIPELNRYRVSGSELADAWRDNYQFSWSSVQVAEFKCKLEIVKWLPALRKVVMDNPGIPYLYKPNATRRMIGEYFRALVRTTEVPYWEMHLPAMPDEHPADGLKLFLPNMVGRTMFIVPKGGNISVQVITIPNTRITLLETCIALKEYEANKGRLPGELSELVPQYLKEVPIDPVDGKLLRYDPKARRLYSVGIPGWGDKTVFELKF